MRQKILLNIVFVLLLFTKYAGAQYEQVWILPSNLGLDFNPVLPTPINSSLVGISSSSVCDVTGQLLFYTDGANAWDRFHNLMPNGTGLIPPASHWSLPNAGSSLITPMPNVSNKYYIFSIHYDGSLYYSIVDMNLNGGLGDVETGSRSMFIHSGLTWQLQGVAGDRCDLWVLTTSVQDTLKAFNVNHNGINHNPVRNPIKMGNMDRMKESYNMDVSPDRSRLAIPKISANNYDTVGLALYEFDPLTAGLSNPVILAPITGKIGGETCFSPDNSKLYVQNRNGNAFTGKLEQFDLSTNDSLTIVNSKVVISNIKIGGGMRRGPDGKIYERQNYINLFGTLPIGLSTINFPNLPGLACQYIHNSLQFGPLYSGWYLPNIGFPQIIMQPHDSVKVFHITTACFDTLAKLRADEGTDYFWSDGSSGQEKTVSETGTYWVRYNKYCTHQVDTFHITFPTEFPELKIDNSCSNASKGRAWFEKDRGDTSLYLYSWKDSEGYLVSENDTLQNVISGTYTVTLIKGEGCDTTIEFFIPEISIIQDLGTDTSICKDISFTIQLNANVPSNALIKWSIGSSEATIKISDFGTYWVHVSAPPCFDSDTIKVLPQLCECDFSVPNAFSPNGDGLNDIFSPVIETGCSIKGYSLRIYNRYGQLVFQSQSILTGWNGYFKNQPAAPGVYFYEIAIESGTNNTVNYKKGEVTLLR